MRANKSKVLYSFKNSICPYRKKSDQPTRVVQL